MKFVPKAVTRAGSRSLLKLNGASPTLLVVAGVGGLVATAVLASKASRKLDPILEQHKVDREAIDKPGYIKEGLKTERMHQKALVRVYANTGKELTKLYGPTLFVGTASVVAVLGGHKILVGRQIATMAAYSGLLEQFQSYRKRIAETLGEDVEKGIFEGARGEWTEGENKGEYQLTPVFDPDDADHYLRPWYDERNVNWVRDAHANYLFLKGVQAHMNMRLAVKGHVFLNEVFDALGMERCAEGQVAGWVNRKVPGLKQDHYIDFGFMTSIDPHTIAFNNGAEKTVRLNFNIDGVVWNEI